MLTAKSCELFLQKNSIIDIVIYRVLDTPLRVYFHSLFVLEIILYLEFHILMKLMVTGIHKHV